LEETTFELREVLTQLINVYLLEISTGIDKLFFMTSSEVSKALWNPYEIIFGWIPLSKSDSAAFKSAPARTTTDVVPSPAYTSCAFEISTSIFAVGCTTSIFCKIVAPSLVISVSPRPSLIILSMPLGPRLVLMQSATALAAWILVVLISLDF